MGKQRHAHISTPKSVTVYVSTFDGRIRPIKAAAGDSQYYKLAKASSSSASKTKAGNLLLSFSVAIYIYVTAVSFRESGLIIRMPEIIFPGGCCR